MHTGLQDAEIVADHAGVGVRSDEHCDGRTSKSSHFVPRIAIYSHPAVVALSGAVVRVDFGVAVVLDWIILGLLPAEILCPLVVLNAVRRQRSFSRAVKALGIEATLVWLHAIAILPSVQ